jgi:ribosome-binding factor A
MAQGNRMERVSGLVQSALADILLKDSDDPRFRMVTILNVSLAKDLSSARVFVSVWQEDTAKEVVAALNESAKHFRYALAQSKIQLRIVPNLKFVYDDTIVRGSRINNLINTALKDIPDPDE